MENEKKKNKFEDAMDSVADILAESEGAAEKVAEMEKRLSKAAVNAAEMSRRIAALETENEALRNDRAMLRMERNDSCAILNSIVLAIAKLKCRNASIN